MKLRETITNSDLLELIVDTQSNIGIFKYLFNENDILYKYSSDLCKNYYLNRSGEKEISATYENILNIIEKNDLDISNSYEIIANMIKSKFYDKWLKEYNLLKNTEYNVLNDYEHIKHRTEDINQTNTQGKTSENNSNSATKITTTNENDNSNNVYGFNSTLAVGENNSFSLNSETVLGNENDNFTKDNFLENIEGTKNDDIEENININGRNVSGAKLLEEEIRFRNKNILFDMILRDIDTIVTLSIYI